MKPAIFVFGAVLLAGCGARPPAHAVTVDITGQPPRMNQRPEVVVIKASDGAAVTCDSYKSATKPPKGIVLMFHQAGSNAGEYETIAPKIAELGYDCLALDQRSGGDMWNRDNRTPQKPGGYMVAYKDLSGAVDFASRKGYKRIVAWGSSYSSALCFRLAADGKKLDALLVFSPGEYFDDKNLVKSWASKVKVPVFFACTPDELKDGREALFNAIPTNPKSELAVFPGAVHGSSTLIPDKAPDAAPIYWTQVLAFFKKLG